MGKKAKINSGWLLLVLLFTISALAGGCETKEGEVKEYEDGKAVTLTFFGTEILNS